MIFIICCKGYATLLRPFIQATSVYNYRTFTAVVNPKDGFSHAEAYTYNKTCLKRMLKNKQNKDLKQIWGNRNQ